MSDLPTNSLSKVLHGESATLAFAASMAPLLTSGGLIFLQGTLGAGKTAFSRGLIQAMGHQGPVKSPTYTLVEDYPLANTHVYHFDLYRLGDPEELEFMGIRDYIDGDSLCLIEWPDKGQGVLPAADLTIELQDLGESRRIILTAASSRAELWLQQLAANDADLQAFSSGGAD
ncbi:tRNA (adenosine(37)-N6)-threonylcarbamoyltransferase complex ATPase subunit type 1 TsaE [Oceanobacter kriegii]|uniref:tRNA (adenosine(37)-N6)-threonylcarbamoyltransferase complex ATPase subunit type 1 TsaE n=1 Tax=Oceanobacter kriegii TaxID=64972 RepID=UPI0006863633|nr:tRNA (adenosine(37)-N6)-threonylcarbamoyltransferase complex ATPase subunit type 1 TsaE [Oceanobacter kriegii]